MAFVFSDSFDELESTRLSLKVLTKEQGNEKEIPYYWYEIRRKPDNTPIGKVSIRIFISPAKRIMLRLTGR